MSVAQLIKNDPDFQKKIQSDDSNLHIEYKTDILNAQKIIKLSEVFIKVCFTLFLTYLSFILVTTKEYNGVFPFDYTNVVIHELGHTLYRVIFSPAAAFSLNFANFMHVAGGSLNQVLVPLFCTVYFAFTKKWYSSFFGIFWIGDNLSIMSWYVADTNCRCMALYIGEDFSAYETIQPMQHDWYNMLSTLGMLSADQIISKILFIVGTIMMMVAMILMFYNIFQSIKAVLKQKEYTPDTLINFE